MDCVSFLSFLNACKAIESALLKGVIQINLPAFLRYKYMFASQLEHEKTNCFEHNVPDCTFV